MQNRTEWYHRYKRTFVLKRFQQHLLLEIKIYHRSKLNSLRGNSWIILTTLKPWAMGGVLLFK